METAARVGRGAPGPAGIGHRPSRLALSLGLLLATACASGPGKPPEDGPSRYRLAHSGTHWDTVGDDRVLEDLLPRYPEFFAVVLEPARSDDPDVRALRRDIERQPSDRRNYDALNAVAIGYFELNYRGEEARASGDVEFLSAGMRAAKLAAIPWRAYGSVEEDALRSAILDFFEDVSRGEKLGTERTRARLAPVVASLARKERDPERLARIESLIQRLSREEGESRSHRPPLESGG